MPLERNTVRSVENFSSGTRGALSVEAFLQQDDSTRVIYFHREKPKCKMPFSVRFDLDEIVRQGKTKADAIRKVSEVIIEYESVRHRLLEIPFVTVGDYLAGLEALARLTGDCRAQRAIFYLPAAVSDFYLPEEALAEHKI